MKLVSIASAICLSLAVTEGIAAPSGGSTASDCSQWCQNKQLVPQPLNCTPNDCHQATFIVAPMGGMPSSRQDPIEINAVWEGRECAGTFRAVNAKPVRNAEAKEKKQAHQEAITMKGILACPEPTMAK